MNGSELQNLIKRNTVRTGSHGMEVCMNKLKILVNSTNITRTEITKNGERREELTYFRYLGLSPYEENNHYRLSPRRPQRCPDHDYVF
ncbi:hypothetical protein DPMN_015711 [Dreissena polymorpha]|uniref:Uncharacterized protein n=1 Tax=Dreissena polymorpha TaxID=45954 RepID=A0A9D4N8A5_DREPO|nr:hypothetical protein DPMN_015711 [Dreissena polymorpha]